MLIEADPVGYGPADVAREIAAVVQAHEADGRTYDLILLGNDAADTGDFQVGIRLAYELGRPVVNGIATVEVDGGVADRARRRPRRRVETFEVPLPAVVTVLEGGVEPRYPTITGRMKAKKATIETVEPRARAARARTGAAHAAARPAQHGRGARRGPGRRARGRRPAAAPGGGPMILVFVETDGGRRDRGVAGDRHVRRATSPSRDRRRRCTRSSSATLPDGALDAARRATASREVHHAVGRRVLGLRRCGLGRRRGRRCGATGASR